MLSFTLLGQMQITLDGKPVTKFRSQKEAALLCYLAHTGQPCAREFLADFLWESKSTKQSLANLRTALARLKKQVGDDVLVITRKTVALALENIEPVDSVVLEQTLNKVGPIDTAEKATTLQNVLKAYQGDFLANLNVTNAEGFNSWVITTREQINRQVVSAYDKLGAYVLEQNNYEAGLSIANHWLKVDHLNEAAQSLRIRSLMATNRQREALVAFKTFTDLLDAELGVTPSQELTDLAREVQPIPPQFPASRPQTAVRHNLPPTFDQFFGRENEQEQIHTRMNEPWCRFVTLVGQGGAGKTRLATVLAYSRLNQYQDGVWFVDLTHIDPNDEDLAEAIAVEIAISLDLRLTGSDTPNEQLVTHLQHKQMLLVLDNFEHVLSGKQIVLDIIQRCQGIQFLATSREALRIRAEWAMRLNGLTYPMEEGDEEVSTAVNLFIARRAQQHWQEELSAEEMAGIQRICRIVEGLPLAIELAAALTRYDSCQTIADRLQDGFDALKATLDDVPERHRGMYTVFEMSWQTLTKSLQQRLARLAYFKGGFDETAVYQITDTTPQHLAALAEKSLLTHNRATQRYRLHPVIQAYASDFRPPTDTTAQKHTAYFLKLLVKHAEPIQKEKPQDSMALLEPDIGNIRLAWQAGLELALIEEVLQALTTMSTYYQLRGFTIEGEAVMQTTVQKASALGNDGLPLAIHAGLEQARFQNRLGRYRQAIQTLKNALKLAEQSADHWAEGMTHVWWGEFLWRLGEYDLAQTKLNHALEIAKTLNHTRMKGWCNHQLGITHDIQHRHDLALKHLERARESWEILNDNNKLSVTLNSIGLVYRNLGELSTAKEAMENALEICKQHGNRYLEAMVLNNLSSLLIFQQDYFGAQYYLQLGLELAKTNGSLHSQSDIYINIGENYRLQKEQDLAVKNLENGLEIAELIGNRPTIAEALCKLGDIKIAQGELTTAERFLQQALEITRKDNLKSLEFEVLIGFVDLFIKTDSVEAKRYGNEAKTLAETLGQPDMLNRIAQIKRDIPLK